MVDKKLVENILVIDESQPVLNSILGFLDSEIFSIHVAQGIKEGIQKLESLRPVLAFVAISQTNMANIGIINWIKQRQLPIAIIVVSNDRSPEVVATAIQSGATDFLQLPISSERFRQSTKEAILIVENECARNKLDHPIFSEEEFGFVGAGQSMLEVSKLIISAAKSNASVFITGENGTGKEVCAELIHKLSSRSDHEMVSLNCSAIPLGLAESALFGHVKGAFTGAHEDRDGVATQAHRGTLFLDEIGEMDLDLQAKLLRFVQSRTFNIVGKAQLEEVDIRFVCATNRDPSVRIAEGHLRQDLFYRLNVIQIHLPPLRNRGADILVFARNFLEAFSKEENKRFKSLSKETETLLLAYSWPGNVRELQNIIRSIVVLHDSETVIPSMLPLSIIREKGERRCRDSDQKSRESEHAVKESTLVSSSDGILPLDFVISNTIERAIAKCGGNVTDAAFHLGVSASTLYRKIKKTL